MKKFLTFAVAVLGLFFASCVDGINDETEVTSKKSSDGGTYIVVGSASVVARTVRGYEADTKNLTDFVLTGIRESDDEITIVEAETFAALTKEEDGETARKIAIQAGSWEFTLTANLKGVPFEAKISATLTDGEEKTLKFELESAQEYGGLGITVEFDNDENLTNVIATLKNSDKSAIDGIEPLNIEKADFTEIKDGDTVTGYSVTYSRSASNEDEYLLSGTYYLVFDFYAEGTAAPINSISYLIRVAKGLVTTYSQAVKLNETYTIKYFLDGSELAAGETRPGKYSRKSETIKLPQMEKTNYVFSGWYTNSTYDGEAITEIATGSSGNLELYAKFDKELGNGEIEVHLAIKDSSDIEVNYTLDETEKPTITFTADAEYSTYAWKIDGEAQTEAQSNVLTVDASNWTNGVYDISLVATDSDGEYFSWFGQISWTKRFEISFDKSNAPESLEKIEIPSQYIKEGSDDKVNEPDLDDDDPTYGWYTDKDFTEPFDFDSEVTKSMVLYGCWDLGGNIYVAKDGTDDTGRGTAGKPLASIAAAVSVMDDTTKDYTIFVDGELSGAQSIGVSNGSSAAVGAKSITLTGKNGSDKDVLKGTWDGALDSGSLEPSNVPDEKYTVLSIATSKPVTIRNLKITGGYSSSNGGGIAIQEGGSVIIDEGTVISGNYAAENGGGIYAVSDSKETSLEIKADTLISNNKANKGGAIYTDAIQEANMTLTMSGGEISGNTAIWTGGGLGGGVYVDFYTKFTMSDGVISGNVALENRTDSMISDYGGKGGGVYVKGTMFMYGDAVIGDSTKKEAAKSDSYSNIANLGGGVYVATAGSDGGKMYMGYSDAETPETLSGGIFFNYTKESDSESVYPSGTGGGVNVQYTSNGSSNNATLAIASGKIAYNASEKNGGGVYLQTNSNTGWARLSMTGGTIFGNKCGSGEWDYGSGVYVASNAPYSADFQMGGSALVSSDNDVWLDPRYSTLTILGELTGEAPVATITPYVYNETKTLLALAAGVTSTSLGAECTKFAVTPSVDTTTETTDNYVISSSGNLVKYDATASTAPAYIRNMTESGTVRLAGEIDYSTITNIRDALRDLYAKNNSVRVALDLSCTTGLTKLSAFDFGVNGLNGGCYNLVSLSLPEGLEEIEELAFKDCSNLALLSIPSTVTKISGRGFYGCTSLAEIEFPNESESFTFGTDKALYSADGKRLVLYCGIPEEPASKLDYTVPAEVEVIGDYAFQGSNITGITFPSDSSLKTIETDAFYGCRRLTAIDIPDSVTAIKGECAFAYCESLESVELSAGLETIDSTMCFMGCKKLTTITIPHGMKSLGIYMFGDSGLVSISLPETLESISAQAFRNCKITSIVLPASLTAIGADAFYGCTLDTVYYTGTADQKETLLANTSDETIKALPWKVPPVSLSAGSESAGAFANISDAVAKINELNSSNTDYTITVSGEFSGYFGLGVKWDSDEQSDTYRDWLPDEIKAKSITLSGKTGNSTDILKAPSEGLGDYVLKIKTSVPVTITNLTITGGMTGIGIDAANANVTLGEGCLVTNNGYSSGVCLLTGKLTLDGGSITDNTCEFGGGVSVFGGEFVMLSGMIGSESDYDSEREDKYNNPNRAERGGAGVYIVGGTFTMTGGSICGNINDGGGLSGAGVYIGENPDAETTTTGTFIMEGGTISGNVAWNEGGGVYIEAGSFTMTGGIISGNKTENGSSEFGGGGVCISGGTFEMNGGSITSNISAKNGNGVYVSNSGTFKMGGSNAFIADNNDVYLDSGAMITITDELAGSTVAKITPSSYNASTQVLKAVPGEGVTLGAETLLSHNYEVFAVTPEGTTNWEISSDGTLKQTLVEITVKDGDGIHEILTSLQTDNSITSASFERSETAPASTVTVGYYLDEDSSGTSVPVWYADSKIYYYAPIGSKLVVYDTCADMFKDLDWLVEIDLSSFDSKNVRDMSYMFSGCSSLTSLDLSGFDTTKVTDMEHMFAGCTKLKTLNISSFDTSSVYDMTAMFYECEALESIDVSKFNTGNVTKMYNMFSDCKTITSLDVSSFDVSKVTDMSGMFETCSALAHIYAASGTDWSVSATACTSSSGMFNSTVMGEGEIVLDINRAFVGTKTENDETVYGYFTVKN